MISREEALANCKSKEHYYDRMVGLGWNLPDEDSRICTRDFLKLVRAGDLFCLRMEDVRKKAIVKCPPTKILQDMLTEEIRKLVDVEPDENETEVETRERLRWENLHQFLLQYPASKEWLVDHLSTCFPDIALFHPRYEFVKPSRAA